MIQNALQTTKSYTEINNGVSNRLGAVLMRLCFETSPKQAAGMDAEGRVELRFKTKKGW